MGADVHMIRAIRGPVTLITLGVLFTLDHFTPYGFSQTWPVLLIVYGLLSLLRRGMGSLPGPHSPGGPQWTPGDQNWPPPPNPNWPPPTGSNWPPPTGSTGGSSSGGGYRQSPYGTGSGQPAPGSGAPGSRPGGPR